MEQNRKPEIFSRMGGNLASGESNISNHCGKEIGSFPNITHHSKLQMKQEFVKKKNVGLTEWLEWYSTCLASVRP
jgi:hypothetical protein